MIDKYKNNDKINLMSTFKTNMIGCLGPKCQTSCCAKKPLKNYSPTDPSPHAMREVVDLVNPEHTHFQCVLLKEELTQEMRTRLESLNIQYWEENGRLYLNECSNKDGSCKFKTVENRPEECKGAPFKKNMNRPFFRNCAGAKEILSHPENIIQVIEWRKSAGFGGIDVWWERLKEKMEELMTPEEMKPVILEVEKYIQRMEKGEKPKSWLAKLLE